LRKQQRQNYKMKITQQRLQQIIKEELIYESVLHDQVVLQEDESVGVDALEWGVMGFALVADFLPGVGTAASTAAGLGLISLAISKRNWLGVALALGSLVPIVGDALQITGRAFQAGAKLPTPVLEKLARGLARVTDDAIHQFLTSNASKLKIPMTKVEYVAKNTGAALKDFKKSVNDALV